AGGVVLAAGTGIGITEGRCAAGLAQPIVVQTVTEEDLVAIAEALVEAGGELVFVNRRGRREDDYARRNARGGQVLVEEGGLRREPVSLDAVAWEGLAGSAGGPCNRG